MADTLSTTPAGSIEVPESSRYKDTPLFLRLPENTKEYGLWESDPSLREATEYRLHIVKAVEIGRLDLLSNLYYGTCAYGWFIAEANNMIDIFRDMFAGQVLKIPSRTSIDRYLQRPSRI